ncbi:unnamed protein product [Spirodela intermedia]|uniref:J domain-containing protein n=1 Tax=Spirodela intermedia TaxID=51605 RepID=A0A7I8J1W1_SPIIN|nr:unnamed protein product [Spirodela intermedia]CAA6664205.1 unnamed protein product [Spirodela intermedia]
MAGGEYEQEVRSEGGEDLYAVLGLKKECSTADLRSAYKRLALRWHPDRCSAAGSGRSADEAKSKFQAIQEAYSVLSDASKRSRYDVGGFHGGEDDADMGDFLGEMVAMMNQTAPTAGGSETFEELQRLFFEMFESDVELLRESPARCRDRRNSGFFTGFDFSASSSSGSGGRGGGGGGYKRDGVELYSDQAKAMAGSDAGDLVGIGPAGVFCVGLDDRNTSSPAAKGQERGGGRRRPGRKQ